MLAKTDTRNNNSKQCFPIRSESISGFQGPYRNNSWRLYVTEFSSFSTLDSFAYFSPMFTLNTHTNTEASLLFQSIPDFPLPQITVYCICGSSSSRMWVDFCGRRSTKKRTRKQNKNKRRRKENRKKLGFFLRDMQTQQRSKTENIFSAEMTCACRLPKLCSILVMLG